MRISAMLLLWVGGIFIGAGFRGTAIHNEYINGCIVANGNMPAKDVRKFCEDKLEAVKLPPKE